MNKKFVALVVFGVAFGFVEAAVVYYLRTIFGVSPNTLAQQGHRVILNLGAIAFLAPGSIVLPNVRVSQVEALREIATLVMLGAVSFIAGEKWRTRLAALLISFASWDLFYYAFLYLLTGWPKSLLDIDVFFIDPIPWVGPVITPVVISLILFAVGTRMFGRG